jgi:hypothetical protein
LTERHDRAARTTVRTFTDQDDAARFLRVHFSDAAVLADLRRWGNDIGALYGPGVDVLDRLATGLAVGRLEAVEILEPLHGGTGASTQPKKEKPEVPKPQPKPKPKPVDEKIAELVVIVKDADGKAVKDAEVTAGALGSKKTDDTGIADYGKVQPGTYDVTAEKAGHSNKKKGEVCKDEKKAVAVPDGTKTTVNLIQHPCCANVSFFEGPTTRSSYYGFDHKTDMPETDEGHYWKPCPDHGALSLPGNKLTRDGARWVSVAVGQEVQLEIDFDFKVTECIPCIANSTFQIVPATVAEVVTPKVTAKKAVFKIKGKAKGEASLKVICDGHDIGWFHIWCENEVTIKLDVVGLITNRAPAPTYDMGSLRTVFDEIFRQALIKVDMFDLGNVDLKSNAGLATIESTGYSSTGKFLDDTETPPPVDNIFNVMNALHAAAEPVLNARTVAPLPRSGAYRLYWYVPPDSSGILGAVPNIGAAQGFSFKPDSDTSRNSCAHEFGHSLNLRHPSDPSNGGQFAGHILSSRNVDTPAYAATNTEPSTAFRLARDNVMADDPTNLMGYWPDRPSRKPLRYHQWKTISRS